MTLPAVLLALIVAGCGTESVPVAPTTAAPSKAMPAAVASADRDAAVKVTDAYWSQSFDAISTTAMSITGGLRFDAAASDAMAMAHFDQAGSLNTQQQIRTLGLDAYSTAESATWSELLNVPMDGVVDVRKVVQETVPATATNGGLCGSQPTRWIALVRRPESEGADSLMLAAFSAGQAPSPQSDDAALCGTYSYAPH